MFLWRRDKGHLSPILPMLMETSEPIGVTPREAQALPHRPVPLGLLKLGPGTQACLLSLLFPQTCGLGPHPQEPTGTPTSRHSEPAWKPDPVSIRHLGSGLDLEAIT